MTNLTFNQRAAIVSYYDSLIERLHEVSKTIVRINEEKETNKTVNETVLIMFYIEKELLTRNTDLLRDWLINDEIEY